MDRYNHKSCSCGEQTPQKQRIDKVIDNTFPEIVGIPRHWRKDDMSARIEIQIEHGYGIVPSYTRYIGEQELIKQLVELK